MFQTISNFMRVGEIRRKIIFTLLMLIIFRIGTFIPVPGINAALLASQDKLSVMGILNTFGGGAIKRFSIFAMGIMPYITASIIIQLLQHDVVPKLTEWSKQGESGRRKTAQLTRYMTVVLGFIEALGMSYGFNNLAGGQLVLNPSIGTYLMISLVLTAGTTCLMWIGELITEKGVGNGISIIIFAGIVANIPSTANQYFVQQFTNVGSALFIRIVTVLIIALVIIAIFVGVIFIQEANRKIPIQYAKRMVAGRTPVGGQSTHMPLKVNAAGVIPVIFAISFIVTPRTIASFFPTGNVQVWVNNIFDYSKPIGMIIYAALIIAFTYFYAFIQVNPEQAAENLQKQSGYIPGIRPGKSTQEYLTRVLNRLTLVGSIYLALISVLPIFFINLANLPQTAQIGGTSLLIVVGVALETYKQLEAQLVKRHYKGFIK